MSDKAETIAGMFALALQPTGSKDPFALRRQANGIVRTIAEHKLPIGIAQLFQLARETYRDSAAEKKFAREIKYEDSIRAFFRERLEFYLRDQLGYKYDVVNAVLAAGADDVVDAGARAEAVSKVRGSADFESISVAFKRIKNILRQADETGKRIGSAVDPSCFREEPEKSLAAQIPEVARTANTFRQANDYSRALAEISRIRHAVDAFFDKVMVMVEDDGLRANRLALLQSLLKEFSTIADFSEIVTEGKASSGGAA
jgi:glycyl-tRNA synthetase beta chain